MKKILILTASYGEGHNAAARNVRDALEQFAPDAQVEVLDLFESCYGSFNTVVKHAHLGLVRFAPSVWGGLYSLLDGSGFLGNRLGGFTRLRVALGNLLRETQPDCVVSTYPVYAHVINELYRDHAERPFRFLTIVTDSISVNSAWFRAPSDLYCVPNQPTAVVMRAAGVPEERLRPLGFPVSPAFMTTPADAAVMPEPGAQTRILYLIHNGQKKAGKAIDRLLEMPLTRLTITVGRDSKLKDKLADRTRDAADRVEILGWTNQMPRLLQTHHFVIGKAGGALVQEAIAARCPMIVNQIIPGQEEGNARLIRQFGLGTVAEGARAVADTVHEALRHNASLWREWRANLARLSRPDAALRIAELVLAECECPGPAGRRETGLFSEPAPREVKPASAISSGGAGMLLCDFHTHTNYSDGKLTLPELVDFYGRRGFDCLCVTDHLADPRRLIGKLSRLSNLTLSPHQLDEYFEVLDRERRRAWRKYSMLLMAGIEFNKDGFTKKSSAHLLGLDLQAPINPALDLPDTIAHIHAQGGLAVASHPHIMKSEWGKNTLYLWENIEQFAPLLDAWEIANRNDIFTPVGQMRLPFLANSDFHKPKHIYSWKTLLHCEKDREAIKACIRRNEHVSITLYREGQQRDRAMLVAPVSVPAKVLRFVPPAPELQAVNA